MNDYPRVRRNGILSSLNGELLAERRRHSPIVMYLLAFEFTCKGLRSRHNALDAISNIRPKGQVECPWFSSTVKPGHDLVSAEQAQLLLELELEPRKSVVVNR
jgi:hypothetical protein